MGKIVSTDDKQGVRVLCGNRSKSKISQIGVEPFYRKLHDREYYERAEKVFVGEVVKFEDRNNSDLQLKELPVPNLEDPFRHFRFSAVKLFVIKPIKGVYTNQFISVVLPPGYGRDDLKIGEKSLFFLTPGKMKWNSGDRMIRKEVFNFLGASKSSIFPQTDESKQLYSNGYKIFSLFNLMQNIKNK